MELLDLGPWYSIQQRLKHFTQNEFAPPKYVNLRVFTDYRELHFYTAYCICLAKTFDVFVPSGQSGQQQFYGGGNTKVYVCLPVLLFIFWQCLSFPTQTRISFWSQIFRGKCGEAAKIALVSCFASILTIWPPGSAWTAAKNRIPIKEQLIQTLFWRHIITVFVWFLLGIHSNFMQWTCLMLQLLSCWPFLCSWKHMEKKEKEKND